MRLVLRQNHDVTEAGVDHVRQRKIDQAVVAAKWNCRLCAVFRQGHQSFTFAASENDCENALLCHDLSLRNYLGSWVHVEILDMLRVSDLDTEDG